MPSVVELRRIYPSLPEGTPLIGPGCMSIIISIIISILITGLAVLVLYLVQKLPIDSTMKQMAQVVVVVVGVVSLLSYLDVF